MFTDIKEKISTMGYLFVTEGLVDLSYNSDRQGPLSKANDRVWYKSFVERKCLYPALILIHGEDTVDLLHN